MRVRPISRMIVPTAAMSIVLLLLGGLSAWYLHRLQKDSSRLLVDSVAKVESAEELQIISHELRYQLRQYLSTRDQRSLAELSRLRQQADGWLAEMREAADTEQERTLLRQIEQGYRRVFDELRKAPLDGPAGRPYQDLLNVIHHTAANEILEPAEEFRDLNRQRRDEAKARNQAIADRLGMGFLLLGTCAGVAGLLAGHAMARGIHRSIAQLTIPVRDAAGQLNEVVGPITVSSGETFEELEATLQSMAQRVATVVKQLQETQLAAARAQQLAAMGQLAAGLAHELRNPLTSMKMLVQPAGEEDSVQLDGEDLTVLRQEIDRLERTIQTFLDYARPPKLEKHPVVLRQILRETVDFVGRRARQLGVEIRSELPEQVVEVEADTGQIRQVLLNLLLNALDASSEGNIVSVRMSCEPPGYSGGQGRDTRGRPDWMTIEVADQGRGLPAELGERIFEPFVSSKDGGTGLGLPICKQIVEQHGGQIMGQNRQGGGAVFTIRLPTVSQGTPAPGESPR